MSDDLPRKFGKYLLERRLGVGGMAETFVARREGKAGIVQHVCIKRVLPAFHRDPEFIKQFQREARLAAKLRHQNIVQVLDFGYVGDTLYMALELVRGVDLRDFLQAQPGKKIVPEYAAIIAHDMIYALDYAHRPHDGVDGIVHRDVTPSNVLLSRNGHAKLADFGVAKAIGTSTVATATGIMKGKMPYMPAEQMKGGAVDGRTDLWSLGVVLYEALAGRRPFVGAHDVEVMTKIVSNSRPKLKDVAPHVPDGFCDMIEKLLSPEPDDRFPNADAVLDAVAPFVPTPKWRRQLADMIRDCYGDTERGPDERDTQMADVSELPANVPGARQVAARAEPVPQDPVAGDGPTEMAEGGAATRVGSSEMPPAGRAGTLYGVGPASEPPPGAAGGAQAPTHLDLAAQARAAAEILEGVPYAPEEDADTDRSDPPVAAPVPPPDALPTTTLPAEPSSPGPGRVIALAAVALLLIGGGAAALFAAGGDPEPLDEPLATAPLVPDEPLDEPDDDLPRGVDPPPFEESEPAEAPPSMASPMRAPMEPSAMATPVAPSMMAASMEATMSASMEEPEDDGDRRVEVVVSCSPWGEVWVGNRYMGRGPVTLRLAPGTHTIRAGAGSPQFTKRVRVAGGRRRMRINFDLDELMRARAEMN